MNQTKKRYWLRGGIIGLLIGLVAFGVSVMGAFDPTSGIGSLSNLLSFGPLANILTDTLFFGSEFGEWAAFLLPYVLIGIIVGGLYGKKKNSQV